MPILYMPDKITNFYERKGEKKKLFSGLYSRAIFFTVIGGGCLLGAILTQSNIVLNNTVERLLQERINLARTTGNYVEKVISHDLSQLAPNLKKPISTIFQEGHFILDNDFKILESTSERDANEILQHPEMIAALQQTQISKATTSSILFRISVGNRPVIVIVKPALSSHGKILTYICGILNPAANNLLLPFENMGEKSTSVLQLVDNSGTVIASTNPNKLFERTDHENLLRKAIDNHQVVSGRCHGCHEQENKEDVNSISSSMSNSSSNDKKLEVLAFSPLPSINLGMAVRQPERDALELAFILRWRLVWLGGAFIALFLIFTGLSVNSVVAPIVKLTTAVQNLETENPNRPLPILGKDEVGQLARALDRWRAQLSQSQAALKEEMVTTKHHLDTLQQIAMLGLETSSPAEILHIGLKKLLDCSGLSLGAIWVDCDGQLFKSYEKLSEKKASCILKDKARLMDHVDSYENRSPLGGAIQIQSFDQSENNMPHCCPEQKSIIICKLTGTAGINVTCLLSDTEKTLTHISHQKLQAILQQIVISVAYQLLKSEINKRHKQSRNFLEKVLAGQEDERLRVARELHDTLAQDLAAHRLKIERLSSPKYMDDPTLLKKSLRDLEENSSAMLIGLRKILLDLRPSVLDEMGFLPALQWYLERLEQDHGVVSKFQIEGSGHKLSHDLQISLFRIFQEALNNVAQHANASKLEVLVKHLPASIELTITDNGIGFNPEELANLPINTAGRGLGVLGMKERSELLKASFLIESAPGRGTSIIINAPLDSGDSLEKYHHG